jgi:exodeoxyribonuclease VII large subunit
MLLTRRLGELRQRLLSTIERKVERDRLTLKHAGRALHAISPLATLERGYSIIFDDNGKVVRSSKGMDDGTPLRARLADGELPLIVRKDDPSTKR